jgi:hypothetical protein
MFFWVCRSIEVEPRHRPLPVSKNWSDSEHNIASLQPISAEDSNMLELQAFLRGGGDDDACTIESALEPIAKGEELLQ